MNKKTSGLMVCLLLQLFACHKAANFDSKNQDNENSKQGGFTVRALPTSYSSIFPIRTPIFGVNFGDISQSYSVGEIQNAVAIARSNGIKILRVYDQLGGVAKWTAFLDACKGTDPATEIQVIMGISNNQLLAGASFADQPTVNTFVNDYVRNQQNRAQIAAILVGNEINGDPNGMTLVDNMPKYITNLLNPQATGGAVPISMSIGSTDIGAYGNVGFCGLNSNLLTSLNALQTQSSNPPWMLFVNIYPFYTPVQYLVTNLPNGTGSQGIYQNFKACYDNFNMSLNNQGIQGFTVHVGEIGWPSAPTEGGDSSHQPITSLSPAQPPAPNTNTNLNCMMRGVLDQQNPSLPILVLFFELFDEPGKPSPEFEKHFGLFTDLFSSPMLKTGITLNFQNPQSSTCSNS